MFMYSDIKMKAKLAPPYSTLKPDTSSDSPSTRSKGVRFVSARRVTNQHTNKAGTRNNDQLIRSNKGVLKLYLISSTNPARRNRAILTS